MKNMICLLLLIVSLGLFSQESKKVLFLGNSYIYSNNLPALIQNIAAKDGNQFIYDHNNVGGYRFMHHDNDPTSNAKIGADEWDFVVLQGQSQEPSFPDEQATNEVYPYAASLANKVKAANPCAIPLFFDTWGRQNGDPQWTVVNTFEKMNNRLFAAYSHMAEEAEGMMAPAGIAFAHVKNDANAVVPFAQLYSLDESHPAMKGSYLTACIFNNIIFSTTSAGNEFMAAGISIEELSYLQNVADYVVYGIDSVEVDFRRGYETGTFSYEINASLVNFTPSATVEGTIFWDFGDGHTATEFAPSHNYQEEGSYTVTMEVSQGCSVYEVTQKLTVATVGLNATKLQQWAVYPNPSSNGTVYFTNPDNSSYEVFDAMGQLIYLGNDTKLKLDPGFYFVVRNGESRKIVVN